MSHVPTTLLDGAVGTELARRGVATPAPLWSAAAIVEAPEVLRAIHRDYAAAGATVHTAATFRTAPWAMAAAGLEAEAASWTRRAVQLVRSSVPGHHRVAGSLAPLADCYRPDLRPPLDRCRREHARTAELLADSGVDLILCETFPDPDEARVALDAALATGLPAWLSVTLGPLEPLLDAAAARETLAAGARAGAAAVLVNCSPRVAIEAILPSLMDLGVPVGAYPNVGHPDPAVGWRSEGTAGPAAVAVQARRWVDEGLAIVGGCCGCGPQHISAMAELVPIPKTGMGTARFPGPR